MIFHPIILGQLHLQSIEYAEYLQRTFESYDSRCFLILKYKGYKRNQRSALCMPWFLHLVEAFSSIFTIIQSLICM